MFCRSCGKEIREDANFCPHCGHRERGDMQKAAVQINVTGMMQKINALIGKIGFSKLVAILSSVTAVVNVLIRICSNEIVTEYSLLAQDDFLVITDAGRTWILVITALYAIMSVGMLYLRKKEGEALEHKSLLIMAAAVVVSLLVLFLRIPAPY